MLRRSLVLATLSLVAGLVAGQTPPGEDLLPTLSTGSAQLVSEGRQTSLAMSETVLGPLFNLPEVMQQLGGELRLGPLGQSFRMRLFDEEVVIGAGSHVITVGDEIVRLSQPPRLGTGGLHVPLDLLERTLGLVLHYDFLWSEGDRRLYAMPRQAHDVELSWNLVHLQGISTLVLQFAERPRYRIDETENGLVVELLGGERLVVEHSEVGSDPLVTGIGFESQRIRIRKAPGATVEHYEQIGPFRLVFDFYHQPQAVGQVEPPEKQRTGRVIVIDPGHGGSETGAVGPSGVEEKVLTLQLARRLQSRLEARMPVRVILTRETDADLDLDRRTAIANQHQADLFISVHLNSSVGRGAHGAETYFLSLEATDAAAEAAARTENRFGGATDGAMADLELILWDLSQSRYLSQSQRLGTLVQSELNQALGLRDRGVKQAPFRVLMGASMPAVLVELGFISNPEEETRLRRVSYQADLVEALVRAVTRYFAGPESAEPGAAAEAQ